jgi:hypothetical protein
MDKFITDKQEALVLWTRLRVSYYINAAIIIGTFGFLFLQSTDHRDGFVAAVVLTALALSHLNYHFHLACLAKLIGKSSNWWFGSFITFPFGPLLSFHFIKPAAMRSGIPIP